MKDLTPDRIAEFLYLWKETQEFIENVYVPDLLAVASFYKEWGGIGGTTNFLAWGEFPETAQEPDSLLMPRGVIFNRDLAGVKMADQDKVTEDVTRGWYEKGKALHPYKGETKPLQEDPSYKPDDGKYTWFKAPRYDGEPCRSGPAGPRAGGLRQGQRKRQVPRGRDPGQAGRTGDGPVLHAGPDRGPGPGDHRHRTGHGRLDHAAGRTTSRSGNTETVSPWEWPAAEVMGVGLNDVPRGSLGHWIKFQDKKITNYQYVVPSTWNLGPRDAKGKLGPLEEALIGTPIADPKRPLEVLRTVHSFDPCIACGVHVIDAESNEVYKIRAL